MSEVPSAVSSIEYGVYGKDLKEVGSRVMK